MSKVKKITFKVINYSDIPEELTRDSILSTYKKEYTYVECHFSDDEKLDKLDIWLLNQDVSLKEGSFLVKF
ncbi:MAG TPA: hypothetical protein VF680_17275 [Allosphingosinicella sp.]|jgi:hypothetical protein